MKYLSFTKVGQFIRWLVVAVIILYIALVIYRIPAMGEKQKTADAVAEIHAQKITLRDVMGENLPAVPDVAQNSATVAGIDANHNGIRDDIELVIFKKYSNSAKIRAAELQYALALQVEMEKVFNSDTWVAAAQEDDRGYQCLGQTYPRTDITKALSVLEARSKEVQDLVFNTQLRKDAYEKVSQFTTSYGLNDTTYCTINLASLPN